MQERRWNRFLPLSRLQALGLRRQPSVHAIGTYAVHAIAKHTDRTHHEALALIDQLLAIGSSAHRGYLPSWPQARREPAPVS